LVVVFCSFLLTPTTVANCTCIHYSLYEQLFVELQLLAGQIVGLVVTMWVYRGVLVCTSKVYLFRGCLVLLSIHLTLLNSLTSHFNRKEAVCAIISLVAILIITSIIVSKIQKYTLVN
jgi:hypothetical protein